jgi:hypothetical protein
VGSCRTGTYVLGRHESVFAIVVLEPGADDQRRVAVREHPEDRGEHAGV